MSDWEDYADSDNSSVEIKKAGDENMIKDEEVDDSTTFQI